MLNFVHFLRALIVIFIGILGCLETAPAAACTSDEITLSDNSCVPVKFSVNITTTRNNVQFHVYLAAKGNFYFDWGDGSTVTNLNKQDTTKENVGPHRYAKGSFVLRIGGTATEYSSDTSSTGATISFYSAGNAASMNSITGINGNLGSLFPTINSGSSTATQPSFYATFRGCTKLKGPISEHLFDGISGPARANMFTEMFYGCTSLTGYVPYNLFDGITGISSTHMNNIFYNDTRMDTTCPTGTTQFLTGYENYWNTNYTGTTKTLACKPDTAACDHEYNGACPDLCSFGTQLKTSNGLSFPIFATKVTTHAINVRKDGVTCYIPLESGNGGSGSLNIAYNNTVYHAGVLNN